MPWSPPSSSEPKRSKSMLASELRPEDLSHTGVRQVRKLLDDLNLRVSAVTFRTRRGYDVSEDLEPRVEATKRALRLAYDLGTGVVINHIGRVPATADAPESRHPSAGPGRHRPPCGQRSARCWPPKREPTAARTWRHCIARLPPGSIGVDLNPANLIVHGHDPREAAAGARPAHSARPRHRRHPRRRPQERPRSPARPRQRRMARAARHSRRAAIPRLLHRSPAKRKPTPPATIRQAVEFLRNI